MSTQPILGNKASVVFPSLRGQAIEGKVDTGATTSSLHAEDIQVGRGSVRFRCPALSSNFIELPLDGSQEVHSADAGGNTRPIVSMDVEIDGVSIPNATFNLNDRSGMDSDVLIGQNILQPGGFIIDPSKGNSDNEQQQTADVTETLDIDRAQTVMQALQVLAEQQVTIADLMMYMQTAAVNRIKD